MGKGFSAGWFLCMSDVPFFISQTSGTARRHTLRGCCKGLAGTSGPGWQLVLLPGSNQGVVALTGEAGEAGLQGGTRTFS